MTDRERAIEYVQGLYDAYSADLEDTTLPEVTRVKAEGYRYELRKDLEALHQDGDEAEALAKRWMLIAGVRDRPLPSKRPVASGITIMISTGEPDDGG